MMSVTEHESIAIRECIKQLKDCAEFLQKSADDVENEIKELNIVAPSSGDKKEQSKDYERIRKSIKKIYKEGKQKIHNIGKCMKDTDENNLDSCSVAEEEANDDQTINDPLVIGEAIGEARKDAAKTDDNQPIDTDVNEQLNGDDIPVENGQDSPEFLTTVAGAIESKEHEETKPIPPSEMEVKSNVEESKSKIRLVAIEKLLDPKVMASSSCSTMPSLAMRTAPSIMPAYVSPNIVINTSSSIIILDSDEETMEPTPLKSLTNGSLEKTVVQNGAKESFSTLNGGKENQSVTKSDKESQPIQALPKVKPLKIRISRCKVAEDLLKAGRRRVKVSKISSKNHHRGSESNEDGETKQSKRRRRDSGTDSKSDRESSSGDDSDFVPASHKRIRFENGAHPKHKYSDKKRSRSKKSKSNHSDEDQTSKRKEDKEKEGRKKDERKHKASSSSKHRSRSHSSSHRNKVIDDDSESGEKSDTNKQPNMMEADEIEARLEEMESGVLKDDDNVSTTSKTSKASESSKRSAIETHKSVGGKENAPLKSGKSKKTKSDDSSSDETIINLKKKFVRKSPEDKKKNGEDDEDDEKSKDSGSSSDEEIIKTKKKHSRQKRIRTSSASDSDAVEKDSGDRDKSDDDDDDDDDNGDKKKKKNKKSAKGSDGSGSDTDTPSKRKNIRHIIKTKNLDDCTRKATEAEKERRKRVEERQKLYNQIFEKPESAEIDNAVLDFDPETKEELLSIDKGLVKRMKPHQVQGVKFMWDACFETIKDITDKPGSGCILGHCMGLGKTLQVVALSHTLLANSEKTSINTVLVITPLSTVTNWAKEFHMWIRYCKYKDLEVYDMSKYKDKKLRTYKLQEWQEDGGVCVIGYDMYRILANPKVAGGKKMRQALQTALVDPGPDLIVCDEGHLLKNEKTSISKAVSQVRTLRRIVLSGTPLQNNLKEYYCMVQFVKPNLLGTYKEYLNRFVNPISNGQFTDSTERDIRLMKNRSHVLHKMLEGCIQRRDYSVLAPYLPPKHEYVIFISLSELQKKLYEHYMTNERSVDANGAGGKGTALFKDFQNLRRIWTHPMSLRVNSDEVKKKKERKALMEDDNSMDDFIADDDETSSESEESNSDSDSSASSGKAKKSKKASSSSRRTRQNAEPAPDLGPIEDEEEMCESEWWKPICNETELKNIHHSPKLLLLFEILQECETIGDKVLLFSQSLQSLDVIEAFLALIHKKTQGLEEECDVNGFIGSWRVGLDYFRLDGSCSVESRELMCKRFNNVTDYRARLFLISTRAGSLGINLVAANRVIIFDASWNPSHDTQSIFRVYRFGQEKPCYIYRFIAKGTMEEKVYERQVMKQATAKRVIDEHQIGRHYNSNDLMELYQYDLSIPEVREVPILPKDRLFAEIIKKNEQLIVKYHEHDSLLENKESENLSEEERKAAWAEFENEKNQPATSQYVAYSRPNYRNGPVTSSKIFGFRSDVLLRLLNLKVRRDHPQLNNMGVGQLVPMYLRQLYEQMNAGNPSLFNELNEMNRVFEMPTNFSANQLHSNYIINPFFQPPAAQNAEPAYIHEID